MIALTVENPSVSYISHTAHFLTAKLKLESVVLGLRHIEVGLASYMKSIMQYFALENRIK